MVVLKTINTINKTFQFLLLASTSFCFGNFGVEMDRRVERRTISFLTWQMDENEDIRHGPSDGFPERSEKETSSPLSLRHWALWARCPRLTGGKSSLWVVLEVRASWQKMKECLQRKGVVLSPWNLSLSWKLTQCLGKWGFHRPKTFPSRVSMHRVSLEVQDGGLGRGW